MRRNRRSLVMALGGIVAVLAAVFGLMWVNFGPDSASADLQPVEWTLTGFSNPLNVNTAMPEAARIVEGTVSRAGPSLWTTSDGTRQEMTIDELRDGDHRIVTPYRITPSKVWKGPDTLEPFTVYQLEGTIGGDRLIVEDAVLPLKEGGSGIYFAFTADEYLGALEGELEVAFAVTEPAAGDPDLYTASPQELEEARNFLDETFGRPQ